MSIELLNGLYIGVAALFGAAALFLLGMMALMLQVHYNDWRSDRKIRKHLEKEEKNLYWEVVFKGAGGTYAVAQDGNLFSVDKVPEHLAIQYTDGQHDIKSIFRRNENAKDPGRGAHFGDKDKALSAGRKWAGIEVRPSYPVPNRRAAIAHARAQG